MTDAKYVLIYKGRKITHPKWIDAPNGPFKTAKDARDWGHEICVGSGIFTVKCVATGRTETTKWIDKGGYFECVTKSDEGEK